MSFTTPSPALVVVGERRRGAEIVLACVVGFMLGQIVAPLLAFAAYSLSGSPLTFKQVSLLSRSPWWWITSSLIGIWIGFGLAVFFVQRRYRVIDTKRAFRFRAADLLWVPGALGLQFAVGIVYSAFGVRGVSKPTDRIIGTSAGWSLALVCVLTIIGAPFFEEMFFRGTLLIGLRDLVRGSSVAVTAVLAISLDGVLFGLAHAEWVQLPALAFVGMVLAWTYWSTGRLWPCLILHSSFNAFALIEAINLHPHT